MLLASFFYNGIVRWQFGFDNPNKLAVLAVELVLIGLALACSARRFARILGAALAVGSLYILLHTFSRGGIVALAVASVPLALVVLRRMKSMRTLVKASLLTVVVGFCLLSIQMGVVGRLAPEFLREDRSVGNRLELWQTAPRMMLDAPFGWGIGNSGEAYMQWYQPLDRKERYRTLVNSHLTWIVETGIVGGVIWLLGWSVVLPFGFIVGRRQGTWLCWAEWVALFVAALFSSVCESWCLWVIPLMTLVCVLVSLRWSFLRLALFWGIGLTGFLGCVASAALVLQGEDGSPLIRKRNYGIQVGRTNPLFWLVPDSKVLGGEMYPREIREFLTGFPTASFVIVQDARQILDEAEVVVVCGEADDAGRRGRQKTIWLSPKRMDLRLDAEQVIIVGTLSSLPEISGKVENVIRIEGAGDYIPDWMSLLCSLSKTMDTVSDARTVGSVVQAPTAAQTTHYSFE